jgi:glucosyl-3-phosphoglycerate phosphatase
VRQLVLVRHAESRWNAEGRVQGQSGSGLSERGHAQAAALAAALASQVPGAALVTSDLERARQTAHAVARRLGVAAIEEPRLRERDFGAWERRLHDEIEAEDGERWRRWRAGEDVIAEIGGESATAINTRAASVFADLIASTPEEQVTVAVTHGGTIWRGLHRLLSLPEATLGPVDNASVAVILAVGDDRPRLGRWNEVGHLPAELRGQPQRIGAAIAPRER